MGGKKRNTLRLSVIISLGFFLVKGCFKKLPEEVSLAQPRYEIKLPPIQTIGKISVEEAIAKRRSTRSYKDESLNFKELSQLLWTAQGITAKRGGRTVPSAGALHPLEISGCLTFGRDF